jgi:GrpB-like predicted nucleotidyltransferase (UPF0157 family)
MDSRTDGDFGGRSSGDAVEPTPPSPKPDYVLPPQRLDGPIQLVDADPRWSSQFEILRDVIHRVLGRRVLALEHVGSTSVPGLLAKPILDISLVVSDPASEQDYVPMLATVGYVLHLREPDWFEHRLLRHRDPAANVHVFGPHSVEVERMICFRDLLRTHAELRQEYASAKRELAAHYWDYVQDYANAKSQIVERILAEAQAPRA